jgi:hypothetical protein
MAHDDGAMWTGNGEDDAAPDDDDGDDDDDDDDDDHAGDGSVSTGMGD